MTLFPDVRKPHVYGWISIICFTSAVIVAVSGKEELQTVTEVAIRCGENVTLPCQTSTRQEDVILFSWVSRNKTCQHGVEPLVDSEILCESVAESSQQRLTLTLLHVMPSNQGEYICKLHSKHGIKFASTLVRVQDCFERYESSINKSHASCWFGGVYPAGVIHWFQEDVNLTDSASTWEEEDRHGRYNVSSTVAVRKANTSGPFKCSLWIPSAGKYLTSQNLNVVESVGSSGDMVKLQWSFILVQVMMVKFTT